LLKPACLLDCLVWGSDWTTRFFVKPVCWTIGEHVSLGDTWQELRAEWKVKQSAARIAMIYPEEYSVSLDTGSSCFVFLVTTNQLLCWRQIRFLNKETFDPVHPCRFPAAKSCGYKLIEKVGNFVPIVVYQTRWISGTSFVLASG
jgi:hypothetical protein